MKCPKCGHGNPEGTLFCEECDWRTDQDPKRTFEFPRIYVSAIALILGAAAVVLWYLGVPYGAAGAGAAGMMLGSYSMTFVRMTDKGNTAMMAMTAISICASVIGFMMGLNGLV